MERFLVTGGAGFIGSHIAETLADRGEKVRVLDNFLTGKPGNMETFRDRVEFIEGDIRDLATCRKAVDGMDYVIHEAALPSVPRSVADPALSTEINVNGTLNMLIAARDAGVRSLVLASSSSVYGDDPRLPKIEGEEGELLSPYAATKLVNEKYAALFHRLYGLRTVCLRYFNVFGPRQDPASQYAAVVPLFITRVLRGERPTIFGDGEQSRDFTYVANVVEANILAARSEKAAGRVMNVACGDRITVNELLHMVGELTGKPAEADYEAPRPGDIKHSLAGIQRAVELIGFKPLMGFREGLQKTIKWYMEQEKRGK